MWVIVAVLEGGFGSSDPSFVSLSAILLLWMSLCLGTQVTLVRILGWRSLVIFLRPI